MNQELQEPNTARLALVVDDDPILCEIMSARLASLGFVVRVSADGEDALLQLASAEYAVAIIDLKMPRLDGFELLAHIRSHPVNADMPVIVATTSDDEASIENAYRLGASSFTTKPINWAQFGRHVQFVVRNGTTERQLRHAKAAAESASRLKSGLFQMLGHELKTPLVSLVGFAGILSSTLQGRIAADEIQQLDHIVEAAQRLNAIVGDILLYSKALAGPDQLDIAEHQACDILDDAAAGFKNRARERQIKLSLASPPEGLTCSCDAKLVQRALNKLIDNAIKFSPESGRVEVWAERGPDDGLVVSVRDQGPGMTAERLDECLQPFVQGDSGYGRPAEGMGLGLPVARTIAEAHGGSLTFETVPGKGTTAILRIPGRDQMRAAA